MPPDSDNTGQQDRITTSAATCPVTFGPHTCGLPAGHYPADHECPLTCPALDHECIKDASCEPGDHTGTWPCEMGKV